MKSLFLASLVLLGCSSGSSDPPKEQPKPTEDTGVVEDTAPPGPQPGDPPLCPGEPSPGTPPSARADHTGVLDKAGKRFVVFGGDTVQAACGEPATHKLTDETFVLDVGCGTWKPISSKGPSARTGHAMASDIRRDRAVVFGGLAGGAPLNDLWGFDFDGDTWTKLDTSGTAPSARSRAIAVYDPRRDKIIVLGGDTSSTETPSLVDDAFVLNLEFREWSALATTGEKPPARTNYAAVVDNEGSKLYVFGGSDGTTSLNDLYALDLASNAWSKLTAKGDVPANRVQLGLSYDPVLKRLVVFGGRDDKLGNQNDVHVYELGNSTWTRLNTGDNPKSPSTGACAFPADYTEIDKLGPERRSGFAFIGSRDGLGFLLHGGRSDCGLLADAMWFNVLNEQWFPITTSSEGHTCPRRAKSCSSLCK